MLLMPIAVAQADVHLAHIMQRADMLPPGTRPLPPSTLVSAGGSAIANVYSTGAKQQQLTRMGACVGSGDPEAGISLGPSVSPTRAAGARRGESAQVDAGEGADLRVGRSEEMVAAAQSSSMENGNGSARTEAPSSVDQPAGISSSLIGSGPTQSPVAVSMDAIQEVSDDLAAAIPLADQQERLGSSTDALLQEQQQERAASHGAASTSQPAGAAAINQGDLTW